MNWIKKKILKWLDIQTHICEHEFEIKEKTTEYVNAINTIYRIKTQRNIFCPKCGRNETQILFDNWKIG